MSNQLRCGECGCRGFLANHTTMISDRGSKDFVRGLTCIGCGEFYRFTGFPLEMPSGMLPPEEETDE